MDSVLRLVDLNQGMDQKIMKILISGTKQRMDGNDIIYLYLTIKILLLVEDEDGEVQLHHLHITEDTRTRQFRTSVESL